MRNFDSTSTSLCRVLIVSHYYEKHGGGIERVVGKLMREMNNGKFSFTWAASGCDKANEEGLFVPLPMACFNIIEKYIGIPFPLWGPRSLLTLWRATKETEVVWLHDTLYPGNILAFLMAKFLKKKILITHHIRVIPYKNVFLRSLMRLAERLFTFPMLAKATQTTFISDSVAEYYYHRVAFTKALQIIPNGVDSHVFHMPMVEKRTWLRQQFALRDDQPVMLFVGRFVEKKGMSVIKELATLLPSWRFWLAGRGPINPQKWHLPNVHVFNDRYGESLAELYQAADILLLPSYGEGFPLVIQESFACGLPVMCSPTTATGSRLAMPLLIQADVWPESPKKTARSWLAKLKILEPQLPHRRSYDELANFAASTWVWRSISSAYTNIILSLT